MKHGRGIKDLDDKSSGMEILMSEAFSRIKPTDPLTSVLTRQLVFGQIYLMHSGVYCHNETVLSKIVNMQFFVPRECYLRVLFDVSPSIITDTENKLKFLVRHGYIRSAATRS